MNKRLVTSLAMARALARGTDADTVLHNGVVRVINPWDDVHLSKAERKGKTPEEIQAMRKQKWEELA
jgi:hypothetical protein